MDPAGAVQMTEGGQALINASILGPVLIFAGWLIIYLLRRLIAAYELLATKQEQLVDRVLSIVQQHNESTRLLAEAMADNTTALTSMAGAVERNTKAVDDTHKVILSRHHGAE